MRPRLLCLLLALALPGAASAAQDMLLGVKVAGLRQPARDVLVREDAGRYYVAPQDLEALGLTEVEGWRRLDIDHLEHVELTSLGTVSVDLATLTATLTLPPDRLPVSRVRLAQPMRATPVAETGAYVNYRLGHDNFAGHERQYGLFEGHITTASGWDIASTLGVNSASRPIVGDLSATLRMPAARESLRLGTSYSTPGTWGAAGRYIGLQYRTDRTLQPGYVTRPTLAFSGVSTAPGTAQLFVDGRRSGSAELNAGPFAIDGIQLPYAAGGTVTAQVTDISGATQLITTELIGAPYNLRGGLAEFAFEAGALRRGLRLDETGPGFASATYSRGITDTLTLEGHGEIAGSSGRAGLTATWATRLGTLIGSAAVGNDGQGVLGRVAYHYSTPRYSLAAAVTEPGQHRDLDGRPIARQSTATATWRVTDRTSISATHVRYGEHERNAIGISSSLSSGLSASISAEASGETRAVYASLRWSWDRLRGSVSTRRSIVDGGRSLGSQTVETLEYARSGYTGMRAMLTASQSEHAGYQRADVSYAGLQGEIQGSMTQLDGGRGGASSVVATGAIVAAAGSLHATREIRDAYAVVHVPDAGSGVPVMHGMRMAGRTDSAGVAILPANAYLLNIYKLDSDSLPPTLLAVDSASGTPYRHGPVTVELTAQRPGVLLDVAGATAAVVEIAGKRGWRLTDGGYYVEGLRSGRHLGRAGECRFEVEVPSRIEIGTELRADCG